VFGQPINIICQHFNLLYSVRWGTLLESTGPGVWVGAPLSRPSVLQAMVAPLWSGAHRVSSTPRGLIIAWSHEGE